MTLADELRGIKPCITSPARYVSHDDPVEPSETVLISSEILEWANGAFTARDVANVFGVHVKTASACVARMSEKGILVCVGQEMQTGGRPMRVWRKAKNKAEAAAKRHFG